MNSQEILDELLNTEFKEVKEKYGDIKIIWKTRRKKNRWWVRLLESLYIIDRGETIAWVIFTLHSGYRRAIYLNELYKNILFKDKDFLREVLRHECLHLLLGGHASRKDFFNEAKKRGIIAERNQY